MVAGLGNASLGMRPGERRWVVIPPEEGFWSTGFPAFGNLHHTFPGVPRESTIVVDMTCVKVDVVRAGMVSPSEIAVDPTTVP